MLAILPDADAILGKLTLSLALSLSAWNSARI